MSLWEMFGQSDQTQPMVWYDSEDMDVDKNGHSKGYSYEVSNV